VVERRAVWAMVVGLGRRRQDLLPQMVDAGPEMVCKGQAAGKSGL